ncbi:MAG: GGDEF domain-containing protein [Acidimicrobiales bacterium]
MSESRREEAARWLAGIELGAGVVAFLTITIGLGGFPSFQVYWYLTAGVTVLGCLTFAFAKRIPYWVLNIELAVANIGISYAIFASERTDPAVICVVFYGWIVLYAFSFLRPFEGLLQSLLAIGGAGVAVVTGPDFTAPLGDILFVTGSVVITATFVLRLVRRLSRLAQEDQLTGLPNRRFLEEHLGYRTGEEYDGRIFTAAIIDLDDFKRLNDTEGHVEGDRLLRELSDLWRPLVRKGDVLARWGGDEFLLVMENCTDDEVRQVLHRLFERASSRLTISVGYGVRQPGESITRLLARCDEALYLAKARARLESPHDAVVAARP